MMVMNVVVAVKPMYKEIFSLFYSIDARKLNREKYSQADGRKAD